MPATCISFLADGSTKSIAIISPAVRKSILRRFAEMTDTIETLQARMEAAVRALDFEQASRVRDMIGLIRGGATVTEAERADLSGVERQRPGAMGLGTNRQQVTAPEGWKPPAKPDPMTAGRSSRKGRRKP
jgi:hypothetical protein